MIETTAHPEDLPGHDPEAQAKAREAALAEVPQTIVELVEFVAARLDAAELSYGHGTFEPWDEAVWLVSSALDMEPSRIDPESDAPVDEIERERALNLLTHRVSKRVPLAYLLGEAWLLGRKFRCDPRALVPRSPIAELLDQQLAPWIADDAPIDDILDLCTGGGSLAIIAAQAFPDAQVVGADLSDAALALARDNVLLHELEDRVLLAQGDLYDALGRATVPVGGGEAVQPGQQFDLIVCNPPYVNAESMSQLPAEYQAEPQGALDGNVAGGVDGMDLVRRIVGEAKRHLKAGGHLVLEIGHEADFFEAAFPKLAFTWVPVAAGDRLIALVEREALPD